MANDKAQGELLSFIAGLFDDPKFSDLTVSTMQKTFHAHKVILGSQSAYFAREIEALESGISKLNLESDDPEAVARMLEFLYKLSYSYHSGGANGTSASVENGNGIHECDDHVPVPPTPEIETEAVVPPKAEDIASGDYRGDVTPPSPKKSKKKKRAKSIAPQSELKKNEDESSLPEGAPAALNGAASELVPNSTPDGELPSNVTAVEYIPSNSITAHSRVYMLSAKYEIPALKALALEHFDQRATTLWNSDEFIQACKEVYAPGPTGSDRSMKDVVARVISQNQAVLDKEELKEIIRCGGDLALDLVLRFKSQGGSRSDTDDTWGY